MDRYQATAEKLALIILIMLALFIIFHLGNAFGNALVTHETISKVWEIVVQSIGVTMCISAASNARRIIMDRDGNILSTVLFARLGVWLAAGL